LSASAACRTIIDKEALNFVKWHNKKKQQKICTFPLSIETPVINVFKHFEVCPCESREKLGGKLTAKLKPDVRSPSISSYIDVFSKLSDSLHNSLLKTSYGVVVVPHNLFKQEKRFLVRYLLANGEDVAILGKDHRLRLPNDREINTPLKQENKSKKRNRDSDE
jgi:hypothetical protein